MSLQASQSIIPNCEPVNLMDLVLFAGDVAVNFYVSEQGSINIDAVSVVILPFL